MRDLRKKLLQLFNKGWPLLFIVFLVFLFFWKIFLLKQIPLPADFVVGVYYPWLDYKWGYPAGVPVKNPITTDVVSFSYPMRMLAIEILKKGDLPLWNPHILTGIPLLANFQSAPFSPTNLVYFIFDKLTAWSGQVILQHVLVSVFTYLLLRSWKVSRVGSLLGGVIFAFSGYSLIWSQWNAHVLSASFIPLLLFFADRWLIKGKWKYGIGISVALFFQIISGYPQAIIYSFVALVLLWFIRFTKEKRYFLKTIWLAAFLILGLGLSSFQIFPSAELLSLSQRKIEPHPYEWAFLPLNKVITFVAPDYFGNHATKNYWGPQDYTSNTGFVGVVALVLGTVALLNNKKKEKVYYGLALVIASLILALPTPISQLIWRSGVLGLQAASAHRALVLFNFGIAILASFGVDYFINSKKINLKTLAIPLVILAPFIVYAFLAFLLSRWYPMHIPPLIRGIPKYKVALRNSVLPLFFLISMSIVFVISKRSNRSVRKVLMVAVFTLLVFELFRFGWKFTPFSPRHIVFPKTPVIDFLTSKKRPYRVTGGQVVPINMLMPYGLDILEGYDAVYPLDIAKFIAVLNSGELEADPQGRYGTVANYDTKLLDLVNTKYLLAIKRDERKNPSPEGTIPEDFNLEKYRLVFEDQTTLVLENTSVLPRAYMVYDWEVVFDRKEVLEMLMDKGFPQDKKIILEEDTPNPSRKGKSNIKFIGYEENETIISVKTNDSGFLFVSDLFYPGWKAFIDRKEVKIFRANYAFRAVYLPKGIHEVKFIYQPESFYNGVKASSASFIVLLGLAFLIGKRKQGRYT